MVKQKTKCKILPYIGLGLFGVLFLWILQRLVMPKYVSEAPEGSMIEEYYAEEKNHDVIFIGDCEVYDTFVPAILWENYGISSYVRGSAQQLVWQSYYILEETLQYELPEVVVFNVLALKYNTPQKESYNRMTLDGMKLSLSKIRAVRTSMLDGEELIEYIFPILRYHSRITSLSKEDFIYLFQKKKVTHDGYFMRVDAVPVETVPVPRPLGDYTFGQTALSYLEKMVALCEENQITLILVKAPSLYPYWYEEWEKQVEEYAAVHNLIYINFLELQEECNLDYTTDTYDAGLHLNLSGAEKVTRWFGSFLQKNLDLKDRREEKKLQKIWTAKLEEFYADKEKKINQWLNGK